MKAFFVILLAAVAYAAPDAEAEADPALLYRGLYGALPYAGYSYGYRYPAAYGYGYAAPYYYGNRFLYKREAESEPEAEAEAEAEADPALLYSHALPYYSGYAAHAYAPYAYAAPAYTYTHAAPVVKTVAAPVVKTVAAPVVKTVAAPVATYTHSVAAPVAATYATHAVAAPAYTTYAASHLVKPVSYYANSAGVEHIVAKREADAEAAYPFYGRYYGYRYPYYRGYGYRYGYGRW